MDLRRTNIPPLLRRNTRARGSRRRAVTLLEVALAMGLLVALSSTTYWFYASALETRRQETETARKLRLTRVILDRISNEIRQASLVTQGGRVGLRGEPERIWLSTLRVPRRAFGQDLYFEDSEATVGQYDMVKVEYRIARHPEILDEDGHERALGLARVELLTPRQDSAETGKAFEDRSLTDSAFLSGPNPQNQQSGGAAGGDAGDEAGDGAFLDDDEYFGDEDENSGSDPVDEINWEELYAPEIKHLRFCYFDGRNWWNDWNVQGENPLPQAVMIVIGFEGHPPFGEEEGTSEDLEFCECMNAEETIECEELDDDQIATVVRVPQADPLFRSRVQRETQALTEGRSGQEGSDAESEEP